MECLSSLSTLLGQLIATDAQSPRFDDLPYDILCLGSGWTYTFLGPIVGDAGLKITFTSRSAKSGGYIFEFDPDSDDVEPFRALPNAKAIVIIFPLYTKEAVRRLIGGYLKSRQEQSEEEKEKHDVPRFILLGSTGIWDHSPSLQFAPLSDRKEHHNEKNIGLKKKPSVWKDRHSEVLPVPRAIAENALLALNKEDNMVQKEKIPTSVLCLCGLWGHGRSLRRYVSVLVPTKEKLKGLGSIHMIHGHDVARAILAMVTQWDKTEAQRWMLTNERVYDLWDLCSIFGNAGEAGRDHFPQGPQAKWVQELVAESRSGDKSIQSHSTSTPIRSLPRTAEQLGSALDGTEFWSTFGISPDVPWVD